MPGVVVVVESLVREIVDLSAPALWDGEAPESPRGDLELDVEFPGRGLIVTLHGTAEGTLELAFDAELGIVVNGTLSTLGEDGRMVRATLIDLQARLMADPTGLRFTGGSVDLEVEDADGPVATGSAALVGSRALVLLNVSGTWSQGELELD